MFQIIRNPSILNWLKTNTPDKFISKILPIFFIPDKYHIEQEEGSRPPTSHTTVCKVPYRAVCELLLNIELGFRSFYYAELFLPVLKERS